MQSSNSLYGALIPFPISHPATIQPSFLRVKHSLSRQPCLPSATSSTLASAPHSSQRNSLVDAATVGSSQLNHQSNSRTSRRTLSQQTSKQTMNTSIALSTHTPLYDPTSHTSMSEVVDIYLQQAEAYCEEKQWQKALNTCQEILKADPNNAVAYKFLGKILQQRGQTTDAMGFYAKAIALQPNFPEVYSNLGSLYAKKGRWETAVDYYKKAIERDPTFAVAYFNLAKVWKKLGKKESEINCLATAFRLQPELGQAKDYYHLAQRLESAQNSEAALEFYQRAAQKDETMVEAYQKMADLLENTGDWQNAAACYRKVLSFNVASKTADKTVQSLTTRPASENAADNNNHSLSTQKQHLNPQNIQALIARSSQKQLITSDRQLPAATSANAPHTSSHPSTSLPAGALPAALPPSAEDSLTQQAYRHAKAQDWPTAIKLMQQAIAQSPRSAPMYRSLAQILERSGAAQKAAEAWYRSFLLDPSWPSSEQFLSLGKVLGRYGNTAAAARCFNQIIQADPSFSPAYEALDQLKRSQEKPSTTAIKQSPTPHQPLQLQSQQPRQPQQITESPPGQALVQRSDQPLTLDELKATAQGLHTKGDELQAQGRLEEALSHYQQAAKLLQAGLQEPDINGAITEAQTRALTAHQQGDDLKALGKFSEAIAYYQEAIRLNSNFSWSYHSLGDCYRYVCEYEQAAEAYRQAIFLNPEFVWSHYSLGNSLEQLGAWNEAAQCYRKAQEIDPSNEQVPPRLAAVLQQLLQQFPRKIEYYQALAEQYIAQGKKSDAIATYQLALQIQPNSPVLAAALAHMLQVSDPTQSRFLLDRTLTKIVTAGDIRSVNELANPQTVFALLKHTYLFDPIFYRMANQAIAPEIAQLDDDLLLMHYIEQGSRIGCRPNPLFDDAFYLTQHPELSDQKINLLAHYHCNGHQQNSRPHPFFNPAFYRSTHADVASVGIDPLEHYLAYGAQEGRAAFAHEQFEQILSTKTPVTAEGLKVWNRETTRELAGSSSQKTRQNIGVYCSSLGNYFITEIADFIADALTQAGHSVVRLSQQDNPPAHLDSHWVIAPHEFFYLGEGTQWATKQDWLSTAVMVNVEQPQTTWFSKAFHFLRHTKLIFDINVKSAAIMQTLGFPAYWLPLGAIANYTPFNIDGQLPNLRAVRGLPSRTRKTLPTIDAPLAERPIDIHFIGTLNSRRELFFTQSASWLSEHHCFLHMPNMGTPLLRGQDQALDTQTVIGISRRSKILLNIHRDSLPYFEWHRIIFHGLWQNTLVVTEPCHDIPGLVAGEHFIACELSEMAEQLSWLLNTAEGQATAEHIRRAGHRALHDQFSAAEIMTNAVTMTHSVLDQLKREEKDIAHRNRPSMCRLERIVS